MSLAASAPEVAVFTETNIGTRLALSVPTIITVADFKRTLEKEHFGCFPEAGAIKVHGLMVNLRSCFYYLSDSMPMQYAFLGSKGAWFLHADLLVPSVVCATANGQIVDLDETSSATTSSDLSVGGLIKKYFKSFTDTNNHSSHSVNFGAVHSQAKGKQKYSNPRRKSKLADSPDFTVKTPPRSMNAMPLPKKSKVGRRMVMASYSLGISPCQETVSSLRQSKSGRFKALRNSTSPIRCPVFEISGDSDD